MGQCTGDFATRKRKYDDSTTPPPPPPPPPPPSARRQTGFSTPIIHSQSTDSVDEIELAKQRAQEKAACHFNNTGGGFDSDDSKGFSSGPAGQKPYVSTSSIPSAPGYGGIGKKIEIPNGKECLFIGNKGGEVINYIQREFGVKILVIEDMNADPCSITRTVELTGNADAIDKAERFIMDLLHEDDAYGLLSWRNTDICKKIEIPNGMVDVIIGEGGNYILEQVSGARIQVTRDPHSLTSTVELTGHPNSIADAERRILATLAEEETYGTFSRKDFW